MRERPHCMQLPGVAAIVLAVGASAAPKAEARAWLFTATASICRTMLQRQPRHPVLFASVQHKLPQVSDGEGGALLFSAVRGHW